MVSIREATYEEWRKFGRERPDNVRLLWSAIVIEDGAIAGHGFISDIDGMTWLHDLEIWATDKRALAMVMQSGRRFLQQAGRADDVYTHVVPGSATHLFYLKHGFVEGELVLRGAL